MKIGPYQLVNNLVLAPMAGVTDRPFRQLCRRMGAGMAVSEMVSSNAVLWSNDKTLLKMDHQGEVEPIVIQIAGAEPEQLAQAARFNEARGAQIIDINMGCPAKKVCNKAAGSALMRNEILVKQILQAVVGAVKIPVTLKMRTGWDQENRNALAIAQMAQDIGIQSLAIHGRTRECGFAGLAEYDTIRAIKRAVDIPVFANGDIDSPEKAAQVLDYTQADGLLIGRAAQGRPWIFREISHYLATGLRREPPTLEEINSILLEHIQNLYEFYGEYKGVRVARKHIAWYSKCQPDGANFRGRVNQAETCEAQIGMVSEYFNQLMTMEGVEAA